MSLAFFQHRYRDIQLQFSSRSEDVRPVVPMRISRHDLDDIVNSRYVVRGL